MRRLRPWVLGAVLLLLTALGVFWVLALRLERRITAKIEAEAAQFGARARVERARVRLLPLLLLRGVVVEKPGLWETRLERVSVFLRPWGGRTEWGPFLRVCVGPAVVKLPSELELRLNPSEWDWDARSSVELREPAEGLTLVLSSNPDGRRFEVRAAQLPTERLGRLLLDGAPVLELGVVDLVARWEGRPDGGFDTDWQASAIGAESKGEARLARGPGESSLALTAAVDGLDLARLFTAVVLEPPIEAEALGSLSAEVSASGSVGDPASLVVTQRLDFTPPPKPPPALLRLRGDFTHKVTAIDGSDRTIEISPSSSDFIARADVPPLFVQTLLLAEDAAFFSHRGLDLTELPKALAANLAHGSAVRGASTITQQLAKNLFLSRERSLKRKLQELALAFLLESALGKDRILEIYLNVIEWGPGLHGLRPAARHYFAKEPRALTPKEMAFLVVLIPAPISYQRSFVEGALSPGLEPLVANLLAKLRSVEALSEEEYVAALAETLVFRKEVGAVHAADQRVARRRASVIDDVRCISAVPASSSSSPLSRSFHGRWSRRRRRPASPASRRPRPGLPRSRPQQLARPERALRGREGAPRSRRPEGLPARVGDRDLHRALRDLDRVGDEQDGRPAHHDRDRRGTLATLSRPVPSPGAVMAAPGEAR
jgi:Transglycosylase